MPPTGPLVLETFNALTQTYSFTLDGDGFQASLCWTFQLQASGLGGIILGGHVDELAGPMPLFDGAESRTGSIGTDEEKIATSFRARGNTIRTSTTFTKLFTDKVA
jgi:hypothetical protein